MESKKTFGAYILQRRKELGMTQREFAERLYVTESAVSKWERGLSYPDITLLTSICSELGISEHELLTGSEDTQRRTSEKLANRYLRLMRRYRASWYLIYGLILLGCLIGNLISRHTLDWFFIAAAAVMTGASLTLLPAVAVMSAKLEGYSAALSFGCFTLSLELLLLVCCLYTGGDWFPVTGTAVLFGLTLLVLPFLLRFVPLPACMARRKASVYLAFETVLLIALLLVCCLYSGGDWFVVAAAGTVFGLSLFTVPVFLCQLPPEADVRGKRAAIYLLLETVLLIVLLLVCCLYSGGDWFVVAAAAVIFALSFFITPICLRQLPLPYALKRHRTLLYFAVVTLLLYLLLILAAWDSFLTVALPLSLVFLSLPWGIMLAVRYIPVNGYYRACAACGWTGLWVWLAPVLTDRIMALEYGESPSSYTFVIDFDFSRWGINYTADNVIAIILFTSAAAVLVLFALGIAHGRKKD